jgi:hypothetical protein
MTGISIGGTAVPATPVPAAAPAATPVPAGQATATPAATPPATAVPPATPVATPPADQTSASQTKWYESLADQANKDLVTKKNWASIDDALKSYTNLETLMSQKSAAASAPTTPNDYKFDVPQDFPKEANYSPDFEGWFKGAAHKAGLSQDAAKAVHAQFLDYAKEAFVKGSSSQSAQLGEKISTAANDLKTAWGPENSPTFARNVEMAKRAIRMLDPGLAAELKSLGAVVDVNGQEMVASPLLFKVLAKVGNNTYAEDRLYGGPAMDSNPFDAKSEDTAKQGWLYQNDPNKALMLLQALPPARQEKFTYLIGELRKKAR